MREKTPIIPIIELLIERYGEALGTDKSNWDKDLPELSKPSANNAESPRVTSSMIERWKRLHKKGEGSQLQSETRAALASIFSSVMPDVREHWFRANTLDRFVSYTAFGKDRQNLVDDGITNKYFQIVRFGLINQEAHLTLEVLKIELTDFDCRFKLYVPTYVPTEKLLSDNSNEHQPSNKPITPQIFLGKVYSIGSYISLVGRTFGSVSKLPERPRAMLIRHELQNKVFGKNRFGIVLGGSPHCQEPASAKFMMYEIGTIEKNKDEDFLSRTHLATPKDTDILKDKFPKRFAEVEKIIDNHLAERETVLSINTDIYNSLTFDDS